MAKTLYEVLEVAKNASPETIEAAHKAITARLRIREERDPNGAALARTAVYEAYTTLSSPELRRRYDARLANVPVYGHAEPREPSSAARWVALGVVAVALAGGYAYYGRVEKQRIAAEKALQAHEALLAKQREEKEEAARQKAEMQEARQVRMDQYREQQWMEQRRRETAMSVRQRETELVRAQQDAQRQQRAEEMARQREDMEARRRLELEKRKLQQLERENQFPRRY